MAATFIGGWWARHWKSTDACVKIVPCTPMICENLLHCVQGVYISTCKCQCRKTPTILLREVRVK